jgi:hypothetical protein
MTTREIAAPPVWNIGRYEAADGLHPWPMSADEWMAEAGSAMQLLTRLGVGAGTRVLLTSLLHEANSVWPLVVACMGTGAQHSCADATAGDAFRTRMFLRTLSYDAVLGIDADVLDTESIERLREVPVIAARADAYEGLVAAGLAPHRWLQIGPVLAIGDRADGRAWFDPSRWTIESIDGELVVSSPVERLRSFDRVQSAMFGTVEISDDGGRVTLT